MIRFTLSANAGLALQTASSKILIDALHTQAEPGFSSLSQEQQSSIIFSSDFSSPDVLFFTHCHPDHFSYSLTQQMLFFSPSSQIVLPEPYFPKQFTLSAPRHTLSVGNVQFHFAALPHEGRQYANVKHYGCVIQENDQTILVTGDCALCCPELTQFICQIRHIDIAIVDFPWITLSRCRKYLETVIRPKHIIVNHLPFASDDQFGYRNAAISAAALLPQEITVHLMTEPYQSEMI